MAVTPGGRCAVSAPSDQTLQVWDLGTGECLCTFTADALVFACAVAPDGVTFVADDTGGHVHSLRLENVVPGPALCPQRIAPDSDAPAFGCLHCQVWSKVPFTALGTELSRPNCGKPIQLNPFIIEVN